MIRKIKSIDDILKGRLCNGCGACAALAPDAFEMAETADENWRPRKIGELDARIEESISNACTGAFPSAAGGTKDLHESSWGPVLEVWEGYASDYDIRYKGSSGGAVTALGLFAIEQLNYNGVLHVKARKDNPTLNESAISTNRAELMEGAGSRYAPASIGDKLRLVGSASKPSVVVGKPCDISGAKMVANNVPELAARMGLTISIFCAGVPSHKGTKELLDKLSPDQKGVLTSLDYRGEGWPGNMRAIWSTPDGPQKVTTSYSDGWGNILQKHRQWRCLVCADHTGEHADISVGDPWQTPPEEDAFGKSLIVVRTERGRAFMQAIADSGYLILEKKDPAVLFDAQPNLFSTKGAVWGRSLALKAAMLNAPATANDSFACWKKLPFKEKIQSIAGTLKRIWRRDLHKPKEIMWVEGQRS